MFTIDCYLTGIPISKHTATTQVEIDDFWKSVNEDEFFDDLVSKYSHLLDGPTEYCALVRKDKKLIWELVLDIDLPVDLLGG